jgi:hypothetical protein
MKKLLILLGFFMLSGAVFGQSSGNEKKLTLSEKLKKYEGSFQIQQKDMRLKPILPYNIDELIENNRTENEVKYVNLGEGLRIMVLPKNRLNKGEKIEMYSTFDNK